jgi:hypothetical protein
MRVRRVLIFTVVLVLALVSARVIFAQTRPPLQPGPLTGGPSCLPPTLQYGVFVNVFASAFYLHTSEHKIVNKCWVLEKSDSGTQAVAVSANNSNMNGHFSYSVEARQVSVSAEMAGTSAHPKGNNRDYRTATGSIIMSVNWLDTLTPHSDSTITIKSINSKSTIPPSAIISLKFNLQQHSVGCTGGDSTHGFWYHSIAVATVSGADMNNPVTLSTSGNGTGFSSNNSIIDDCPKGFFIGQGTIQALNGFPLKIGVAVINQVYGSLGNIKGDTVSPSGDVTAGRQGVSICVEHPKTPSDLKIESASGNSYWCP